LHALYLLIVVIGMRRGEVVGLRWEDADFDSAYLLVAQQKVDLGTHELLIGPPKTRSGQRTISLDPVTIAVLGRHRNEQSSARRAWGPAWHETGLVFTQEDGSVIRPDFLTRQVRRLVVRAGLPIIRLHDLRHTSASLALQVGVPMKAVSERLGHSSTAITAGLYTHVSAVVAPGCRRCDSWSSAPGATAARD
jgi:integrase